MWGCNRFLVLQCSSGIFFRCRGNFDGIPSPVYTPPVSVFQEMRLNFHNYHHNNEYQAPKTCFEPFISLCKVIADQLRHELEKEYELLIAPDADTPFDFSTVGGTHASIVFSCMGHVAWSPRANSENMISHFPDILRDLPPKWFHFQLEDMNYRTKQWKLNTICQSGYLKRLEYIPR